VDPCSAADIKQSRPRIRTGTSLSLTCVLVLSIARVTETRTSLVESDEGYPRYEQSGYSGSLPWISTAKVLEVDERP